MASKPTITGLAKRAGLTRAIPMSGVGTLYSPYRTSQWWGTKQQLKDFLALAAEAGFEFTQRKNMGKGCLNADLADGKYATCSESYLTEYTPKPYRSSGSYYD